MQPIISSDFIFLLNDLLLNDLGIELDGDNHFRNSTNNVFFEFKNISYNQATDLLLSWVWSLAGQNPQKGLSRMSGGRAIEQPVSSRIVDESPVEALSGRAQRQLSLLKTNNRKLEQTIDYLT